MSDKSHFYASRLHSVRADMLGTTDEDHFHDCHDAANHIEELERENADLRSKNEALTTILNLCTDGTELTYGQVPDLIADLRAKLEAAQREIKEHNDGCASACKARYESGACAYRNADGSSRYGNKRCHDCPQEYTIDAAMQEGK